MGMIDVSKPVDEDERREIGAPPLVGEWTDMKVAWGNWAAGRKLCKECRGTGNWLYSMYRCCKKCGGSGVDTSDTPELPI